MSQFYRPIWSLIVGVWLIVFGIALGEIGLSAIVDLCSNGYTFSINGIKLKCSRIDSEE